MRLIKNAVLLQIYKLKMWPDKIEFAGRHGHQNLILHGLARHVTAGGRLRGALLLHEVLSPYCKIEMIASRYLRLRVVVLFYKVFAIFTRTNSIGRLSDTLCLKLPSINAFCWNLENSETA